jgi:hypothetical protein
LLARLLACALACLLACVRACLLACLLASLLACLLACLLARSSVNWLVGLWVGWFRFFVPYRLETTTALLNQTTNNHGRCKWQHLGNKWEWGRGLKEICGKSGKALVEIYI